MQWDSTAQAGYSTNPNTWLKFHPNYIDKNVETEAVDPDSILNFYKKLISLRSEYVALRAGEYVWVDENSNDYIALLRKTDEETILVILNLSSKQLKLRLDFSEYGIASNKVETLVSKVKKGTAVFGGELAVEPVEALAGILRG